MSHARILPRACARTRRAIATSAKSCEARCAFRRRRALGSSAWLAGAVVGGVVHLQLPALADVCGQAPAVVLLFGHSLGSHRKLVHDSYQCPRWLEYMLVYLGVQVGLAGPIGLLRQHELRDYAQRLPDVPRLPAPWPRFWLDAWWQLCCELRLTRSAGS